jgi:hypothetical protein
MRVFGQCVLRRWAGLVDKYAVCRGGSALRPNAECIGLAKRGDEIIAKVDCTAGAPEVAGSHLLLAVGRRPNTDNFDLDKAGARCDERGYIVGSRRPKQWNFAGERLALDGSSSMSVAGRWCRQCPA